MRYETIKESSRYKKVKETSEKMGTQIFEYVTNLFKDKNKKKMGIWCVKENLQAVEFYQKKGGNIIKEKKFTLADKEYSEVAFIYDL